ncbi:MAG: YceI family protein, partial [Chloroflexota bacterium]
MRNSIQISLLLFVIVVALSACGLLREPEEASAPIEAVPLEVTTPALAESELTVEQVPAEEAEAYPPPADDSGAVAAYPGAAGESSANAEAYPGPAEVPSGDLRVYEISQADSEVRFELDEDLRGQRQTVVGLTDQIAGEIAVDLADLSTAQVGVIQINARTLQTDNNFRNRAIQNEILDTGNYEFITFSPTSIEGLPASASIGEEVEFVLGGDLTIRDVTNPVQFIVRATAAAEDQLVGTATASVFREDYGLQNPSVPNVANVEEEV